MAEVGDLSAKELLSHSDVSPPLETLDFSNFLVALFLSRLLRFLRKVVPNAGKNLVSSSKEEGDEPPGSPLHGSIPSLAEH